MRADSNMTRRSAPEGCKFPFIYATTGCAMCQIVHTCPVREMVPFLEGQSDHRLQPIVPTGMQALLRASTASKPTPKHLTERCDSLMRVPYGGAGPSTPLIAGEQPQHTVVAIDASPSMKDNKDYPPNRLEAAKEAAVEFILERSRRSKEDKVAIVYFSRRAHRLCGFLPVAPNPERFREVIQRIVTADATSIGRALAATEVLHFKTGWLDRLFSLEGNKAKSQGGITKRVLLLTDGENNAGPDPLLIAQRLKDTGVIIDCIGIGARFEVKEDLLRQIASVVSGNIRYRFIGDRAALVAHYRELGGSLTR